MEKRKYKKRTLWSKDSELALVELWQHKKVELRSARKNSHILQEMVDELAKSGHPVTVADIKNKMSTFVAKYKKEKSQMGPSGGSPSDWEMFPLVHSILNSSKSINTEGLVFEALNMDNEASGRAPDGTYELDDSPAPSTAGSPAPAAYVLGPFSPAPLSPAPSTSGPLSPAPSTTGLTSSPATYAAGSPSPSPSTSRPSVSKKKTNKNSQFSSQAEKSLEAIAILASKLDESNSIEREKTVEIKRYVDCMESLAKNLSDYLICQTPP